MSEHRPDAQFITRTLTEAAARKSVLTPSEVTDHDQLLVCFGALLEVSEQVLKVSEQILRQTSRPNGWKNKARNNAAPVLGGGGVLLIIREIAGFLI